MDLYQRILSHSTKTDQYFSSLNEVPLGMTTLFTVPPFHPRARVIQKYPLFVKRVEMIADEKLFQRTKEKVFILDKSASRLPFVKKFLSKNKIPKIVLSSTEDKVKTKKFLDELTRKKIPSETRLLIVIGGGIMLNIGAFIAEKLGSSLYLCPTTLLSMADGSGGKVRVNTFDQGRAYKHFYKSYYEPDAIFIDPRFLESLPKKQIQVGLGEIIKHALFQSPPLYHFLDENKKNLFTNREALFKAGIWTAHLKRVCLDVDVEENENGSRKILRGGHDFSDRLEEDLKLRIPHGFAVSIGIVRQLKFEKKQKLLKKAIALYDAFGIPKTIEEFKKLK